jgi:hypothetical protein
MPGNTSHHLHDVVQAMISRTFTDSSRPLNHFPFVTVFDCAA